MKRYRLIWPLMIAAVLAGCATPEAVRNLAERSAANISLLSGEVMRLAAHEARIGELRAQSVADYEEGIERSRAAYNFDLALTNKSGDTGSLSLKRELDQWVNEAASLGRLQPKRREAILNEIKFNQTSITFKSEELNKAAAALAALAKKEDFATRANFLVGYVGEVAKLVEASEADLKSAAAVAETGSESVAASQEAEQKSAAENP